MRWGGAVAAPERVTVKRILVVADHTLCEQHLLNELRRRKEEGPVQVHLLVPASHPTGAWSEGTVRADARGRLAGITNVLAVAGMVLTGEVSDAGPLTAAADALRTRAVDEITISTLPTGRSRWLAEGVIRRLHGFGLPGTHVVAETADASA